MSTNTLYKNFQRGIKPIQHNGHQLLILLVCPYAIQVIFQHYDPIQVANHYMSLIQMVEILFLKSNFLGTLTLV